MDYTFEAYLNYKPTDEISTEGFKEALKKIGSGIVKAIQTIWGFICGLFKKLRDFLRRFFTKEKKPTTLEEIKKAEHNITKNAGDIKDEKFTQTKEKIDKSIERMEKQEEKKESNPTSAPAQAKTEEKKAETPKAGSSTRSFENIMKDPFGSYFTTMNELNDAVSDLADLFLSSSKKDADKILKAINVKVNMTIKWITNDCDLYKNAYPTLQKKISAMASAATEEDARVINQNDLTSISQGEYGRVENPTDLGRFTKNDDPNDMVNTTKNNNFGATNEEINKQAEKLASIACVPAVRDYIKPEIMKIHNKVEKLFKICESYKNSLISLAGTAEKIKFDGPKSVANGLLKGPTERFKKDCDLLSSLMTTLMKCVNTVENAKQMI